MNRADTTTQAPYNSNEELIASQDIIVPPIIVDTFRFTTVDKDMADLPGR